MCKERELVRIDIQYLWLKCVIYFVNKITEKGEWGNDILKSKFCSETFSLGIS